MNEEQEHIDVEGQVVEGNEGVTEGVAEPQVQSDKELNFAALRERTEGAERRATEAEQRNRQYEQMMMDSQQSKSQPTTDEEEAIDFSDAVDAEAFAKITKKFERQEKKLQAKVDAIEANTRQQSLAAKDPGYVDTINNYLPDVLKENPAIRSIIQNAPPSQQHELMYQFATSNKDYVIKQHVNKAKSDGRIVEEEKPKVNTMGAMQGGSAVVGKESALNMSHDSFYGDGGYLSKILENKIH